MLGDEQHTTNIQLQMTRSLSGCNQVMSPEPELWSVVPANFQSKFQSCLLIAVPKGQCRYVHACWQFFE